MGGTVDALFAEVDWARLLVPGTPLLETLVRGSLTYLALFALMRFTFKREAGGTSISTLLVVVLIADAAQNAMTGDYTSVTDGVLLVATIIGCSFLLDWLGSRFRVLRTLTHPSPLRLVQHGRLLTENLRKEVMTEEELWTQLRHQGVRDLAEVEEAFLEGDGQVSVLKRAGGDAAPGPARRPGG
jgi:uncharacterized membrane protein YcaP (DUF421 family)